MNKMLENNKKLKDRNIKLEMQLMDLMKSSGEPFDGINEE